MKFLLSGTSVGWFGPAVVGKNGCPAGCGGRCPVALVMP